MGSMLTGGNCGNTLPLPGEIGLTATNTLNEVSGCPSTIAAVPCTRNLHTSGRGAQVMLSLFWGVIISTVPAGSSRVGVTATPGESELPATGLAKNAALTVAGSNGRKT